LTFIGLYGVISPKIELFITTSARTSNPRLKNHKLHGSRPGETSEDKWVVEAGTYQQVAQLLDQYMVTMTVVAVQYTPTQA
jgi:hypothetical protein